MTESLILSVHTRPISARFSCSWFEFAVNQSPAIIPNMSAWWTASRTLANKIIETHIRSSTLDPQGPNLKGYLIYNSVSELLAYQIIINVLSSLILFILVMVERRPMRLVKALGPDYCCGGILFAACTGNPAFRPVPFVY